MKCGQVDREPVSLKLHTATHMDASACFMHPLTPKLTFIIVRHNLAAIIILSLRYRNSMIVAQHELSSPSRKQNAAENSTACGGMASTGEKAMKGY